MFCIDQSIANDAKFINNPNKRLGINGTEEIKSHQFFKGLDWENILNLKAPFIPELKNEYDTHYFDNFEKNANLIELK